MIHRLHIQNFKSILDVTVELSPVTVLVGRSGTGKSNFVESLRFLRDVLSSGHDATRLQQDWPLLQPATNPEGKPSFEIEFSIRSIEERFRYQLTLASGNYPVQQTEERLQLGEKILFHQTSGQKGARPEWVSEPELTQVPQPGAVALGRIPSISEVVLAYTALTSGIGCYAFSDRVLSDRPEHRNVQRTSSRSGLDDDATNYVCAFQEIASNLQDLEVRKNMLGSAQRLNASVSSIELNDIQQPSHVVVGHRFNGKTLALQLSQESDGFRRFLAHLLALYQRPPKQTLLFEHPEDGIHPGALSLLAEEFEATPPSGRGQVILTTHSPDLLDNFEAEQIRVVELDGLQTRIGRISSEQQAALRDKLIDSGELFTVDPARLEQSTLEGAEV